MVKKIIGIATNEENYKRLKFANQGANTLISSML